MKQIKFKNNLVNFRNDCRVCGNKKIKKIIDLGNMPLAGGFIKKINAKKKEIKVPLICYYCDKCNLLQVKDSINSNILFDDYNYSSSTIPSLRLHFHDYAEKIKKKFKSKKEVKLLEFGSNDGVLLKKFIGNKKFTCLGVDPAINISKLAKQNGVNVYLGNFDTNAALEIKKKYGKFDYITGSNVFAHIDDIHSVVLAAKELLENNGTFVTEVHYLPNLIELNQYDFIYHEHLNYYTLKSLVMLFKIHKLKLINAEMISTHGGSIRVSVTPNLSKNISLKVKKILQSEKKINNKYFDKFNENILVQRKQINQMLNSLILSKKKIIGYGASGRGTILLNYCNIDRKSLDYIVDESPLRAGKLMPGVKLPIFSMDYFKKNNAKVDYVLIIAWNYTNSIIKKVKKINKNIKFIVPFPYPHII